MYSPTAGDAPKQREGAVAGALSSFPRVVRCYEIFPQMVAPGVAPVVAPVTDE